MWFLFAVLVNSYDDNPGEGDPTPTGPIPSPTLTMEMQGIIIGAGVGMMIWCLVFLFCIMRHQGPCICKDLSKRRQFEAFVRDPRNCEFYRWFISPIDPAKSHMDEWNDDHDVDFFLRGLQQILDELPPETEQLSEAIPAQVESATGTDI